MPSLRDIFSASGGALTVANSQVDVATAKQAVTDGQAAQASALSAIQAKTSQRPTGGGQFGALNQQRGNLVLGPLGGLATANRNAEAGVEKGANLTQEKVTRGLGIIANNAGWTAQDAADAQTPAGRVQKVTGFPGFTSIVTKVDDQGVQTQTYR